MEPHLKLF